MNGLSQKDDHTDVRGSLACRADHAGEQGNARAWLSALHRIANANLRRCSGGWLQRIAMDALIDTGQRVSDAPAGPVTHESTPEPR